MENSASVLCVGMATYDIAFELEKHPEANEKCFAKDFIGSGGGPASNASIAVARLGGKSYFIGYLGNDLFGDLHKIELIENKINIDYIKRDRFDTKLSVILAKPSGQRTVVTYQGKTPIIKKTNLDLNKINPKAIIFDGHEHIISKKIAIDANKKGIPVILDAGSLHDGIISLIPYATYLVASEKFAFDFTKEKNGNKILEKLSKLSDYIIVTLGEKGLIWINKHQKGKIKAFKVKVKDTTGAGDVFHGAFALGVAEKKDFIKNLIYSGAAGALSCTKLGARNGIPFKKEVDLFLKNIKNNI